ncbi:hypothetical protein BAUCODRAFT_40059, partial [Baudoinia panamericana UAMH 10762]
QAIFVDTDILTDVDDVGALAIANVLHNCGLADLQGVAVNTHSRYGALAVSAINTYFGNSDVPVAAIRPLTEDTFFDRMTYRCGEYASRVAYNWPRALNESFSTPTPVELYRSVLASGGNNSLNMISVGFLTNIADLLRSPADGISSLTGLELINAKVKELIVMGGRYPSGWEYNFGGVDPASTRYVLEHWPVDVPLTFSGWELGVAICSGQNLRTHSPPNSPVFAAYEWYIGRCQTVWESWDPVTVLYGILGMDGFEQLGLTSPFAYANEGGYNAIVDDKGANAWVNDQTVTNQHWLKLAYGVNNWTVAEILNRFLTYDPKQQE